MSSKARWPNRVNVGLGDEAYKELRMLREAYLCNPDRAGFVERVLLGYGIRHFEEAFREWVERGAARTEFRRSVGAFVQDFEASRGAARSFIESFEK